jgi:hypothetical protein
MVIKSLPDKRFLALLFGGRGLEVRVVATAAAVRIKFDSPCSKVATPYHLLLTSTPVPIPKILPSLRILS